MLALADGSAQTSTPRALNATIACERETGIATLIVGDRTLDRLSDDDAPARLSAAIGAGDPEIKIHVGRETPYRCLGGLVFNLQRAGITKIVLVAEPPKQKAEQ